MAPPRSLVNRRRTLHETVNDLYITDDQFYELREWLNKLGDLYELEGIYDQMCDLELMVAYIIHIIEERCSLLRDQ